MWCCGLERDTAVIGLRCVGLVTGLCLADLGFKVISADLDAVDIELVNRVVAPTCEPEAQETPAKHENAGDIKAATDTAKAVAVSSVSFITTGTPSLDGKIDLCWVEGAAIDVGAGIARNDRLPLGGARRVTRRPVLVYWGKNN